MIQWHSHDSSKRLRSRTVQDLSAVWERFWSARPSLWGIRVFASLDLKPLVRKEKKKKKKERKSVRIHNQINTIYINTLTHKLMKSVWCLIVLFMRVYVVEWYNASCVYAIIYYIYYARCQRTTHESKTNSNFWKTIFYLFCDTWSLHLCSLFHIFSSRLFCVTSKVIIYYLLVLIGLFWIILKNLLSWNRCYASKRKKTQN